MTYANDLSQISERFTVDLERIHKALYSLTVNPAILQIQGQHMQHMESMQRALSILAYNNTARLIDISESAYRVSEQLKKLQEPFELLSIAHSKGLHEFAVRFSEHLSAIHSASYASAESFEMPLSDADQETVREIATSVNNIVESLDDSKASTPIEKPRTNLSLSDVIALISLLLFILQFAYTLDSDAQNERFQQAVLQHLDTLDAIVLKATPESNEPTDTLQQAPESNE